MRIVNIILNKIKIEFEVMIGGKINSDMKGLRIIVIKVSMIVLSIIILIVMVKCFNIGDNLDNSVPIIYEGDIKGLKQLIDDSKMHYTKEVIEKQVNKMSHVIFKEAFLKYTFDEKKATIIQWIFKELFEGCKYDLIADYELIKLKEIIKELKENLNSNDYTEKQKEIIQGFIDKFMEKCEDIEIRKERQYEKIEEIIKEFNKNNYRKTNIQEQEERMIVQLENLSYAKKQRKELLYAIIQMRLENLDKKWE